jgi:hypothetical protein
VLVDQLFKSALTTEIKFFNDGYLLCAPPIIVLLLHQELNAAASNVALLGNCTPALAGFNI